MTKTQQNMKVVATLMSDAGNPGLFPGFIGMRLWGRLLRHPQHYARPAGKLLGRMRRLGIVDLVPQRGFLFWVLRAGWERRLRDACA